jgi:hypothetical protein
MPRLVSLFAAPLFVLLSAASASAATYYVSTSGNDANPGTQAAPFATIQKAANVARAGDLILVQPGTYVGAKFSFSGTASQPITLRGQPGVVVNAPSSLNTNGDNIWVRNASYVVIEDIESTNAPRSGIAVQADPAPNESHGVVLRNNHCHHNGRWGIFTGYAEGITITGNETSFSGQEHGIYVSNSSDNPVITNNVAHDNQDSGIQINADPLLPGDKIISNAVIDSNVIYGNGVGGGAAINLASVRFSRITNNLLYDNHSSGIAGWDDGVGNQWGTMNNEFYNNTIVQASNGRWAIALSNGSINNTVRNNVFLHLGTRGAYDIDSSSEPGLDSNYNAMTNRCAVDGTFITFAQWQARGHDPNSFVSSGSALFVNEAAFDYHLKSGSPAINAGASAPGVNVDLDGVTRPQGAAFDIGAYEFASTTCADVVQLAAAALSVGEAAGSATLTITRTTSCSTSVTVSYATSNNTATAGADYTARSGAVTLAAGVASTTVIVPITNDTAAEGNESFLFTLSGPTGASLGATRATVVTIGDNDVAGKFAFGAVNYTVNETAGTATVTVNRNEGSAGTATVAWAMTTNTATAGTDASLQAGETGVLTFGNGVTNRTFTVAIANDTLAEGNESLHLTLSSPTGGAVLGVRSRATLTIADNDVSANGIAFSAPSYTNVESGNASITITRTSTAAAQSVTFATSNGTATAGADYTARTLTVSFAAGVASQTVQVPILADTLVENNECLNLTLTDSSGGSSLGAQRRALINITDNDSAGALDLQVDAFTIGEAGGSATITVTRAGGSAGAANVTLATSNLTATAGSDYTAVNTTVSFAAGQTSKTVAIPVVNDASVEGVESLNLTLSNPTGGATLGTRRRAVLVITDND